MQNGMTMMVQSLATLLIGGLTLGAVVLLWLRSRSVWLMVAIVAEVVSLFFRVILSVLPGLIQSQPAFFALWTLCGLAFATGLLGYAIEMRQRS